MPSRTVCHSVITTTKAAWDYDAAPKARFLMVRQSLCPSKPVVSGGQARIAPPG